MGLVLKDPRINQNESTMANVSRGISILLNSSLSSIMRCTKHPISTVALVFLAGFNAYGGMKTLLPTLIKWVGSAGEKLHGQLADEIRTVVKAEGGVTLAALEKMSLTKSVVYEALRIEPLVPFQYGKAKKDMVVHSHDAAFEIKKGEMIFGYQTFATKDPKVFENPEEFVAHRFIGEGEKLLKYSYCFNGRECDEPRVENKQCQGKDLALQLCRVMLVEFFLRYDTFNVECGTLLLGSLVTFKSVVEAKDAHLGYAFILLLPAYSSL